MPLIRKDLIDRLGRLARHFGVDGIARLDGTLVSIASGRLRRTSPSLHALTALFAYNLRGLGGLSRHCLDGLDGLDHDALTTLLAHTKPRCHRELRPC